MNHTMRFAFAALCCTFAVWWYLRRSAENDARPRPAPEVVDAGAVAGALDAAAPVVDASAAPAEARFRRIDPSRRRGILEQLAARAAGTAAPAGSTALAPLPGRLEPDQIMAGLMPLLPALRDCVDVGRDHRTVTAMKIRFELELVGDADIGTLVDVVKLDGDPAFQADTTLQTCLRETLLAVELPPLASGTRASFVTTLTFDDDDSSEAAGD